MKSGNWKFVNIAPVDLLGSLTIRNPGNDVHIVADPPSKMSVEFIDITMRKYVLLVFEDGSIWWQKQVFEHEGEYNVRYLEVTGDDLHGLFLERASSYSTNTATIVRFEPHPSTGSKRKFELWIYTDGNTKWFEVLP